VQFAQYSAPHARGPLLALVFAIVLAWLGINLPRWPVAIRVAGLAIALGAVLNALVIGLNGRMPYDPAAAARAGLHTDVVTPKNVPAGADTRLALLGDVIPGHGPAQGRQPRRRPDQRRCGGPGRARHARRAHRTGRRCCSARLAPRTSTENDMTRALTWPRLMLAVLTLATLALMLYTIGAPTEISG
jgi:hypothetical protein